jgi:hypothetical protein
MFGRHRKPNVTSYFLYHWDSPSTKIYLQVYFCELFTKTRRKAHGFSRGDIRRADAQQQKDHGGQAIMVL